MRLKYRLNSPIIIQWLILLKFLIEIYILIIGKDDKGWSMYIDRKRSWFMHCGIHVNRCEGGIQPGSTVGVLLDLERHQLSFYVNEELQVSRNRY